MFRSLKTLRSIPRLKDIAFVLGRHGFYQVAGRLHAPLTTRMRRIFRREPGHVVEQPERLRLVLEDLGPTFIKFGQLLSTRPDLLSPPYLRELEKLQDDLPPEPFSVIREILDREFDGRVDELFREIQPEPIAAASIAQVHSAVTAAGDRVVLKVRKPGLERVIEQDLLVLDLLTDFLGSWRGLRLFDAEGVLRIFERAIRRELDFHYERKNLTRLRGLLPERSRVYLPRAFAELSTGAVLTMEHLEGEKLSAYQGKSAKPGIAPDRGEIAAQQLATCFLKQIFEDRLFHADAHPGNIILMNDGRVGLIDVGNVGRMTREMADELVVLLIALVRQDYRSLARWILRQGRSEDEVQPEVLAMELMDQLDPYYGLSIGEIRIGELFNALFGMILRHGISVPPQYVTVGRCFVTLEGAIRLLAPSFDVLPYVRPYVRDILKARWSPRRLAQEVEEQAGDLLSALKTFPGNLSELLARAAEGRLRIESTNRELLTVGRKLDTIATKVPLALVVSALILGSVALLCVPDDWQAATVLGMSLPRLLGLCGLAGSGLLGLRIFLR